MPQPLMPKKLALNSSVKTCNTFQNNTKKRYLFIIGNWNSKVGNQELSGITGKFGLGVPNEAGQRLPEFSEEHPLIMGNALL